MRVTHLYLRNYRVYEEVDLDLPPGLVGIYGPNGGGKSTLVEAIRFALYGHARTTKDEIRTSGVGEECIAELELEHEGHLYKVRRTISGINHTVKASAWADGLQVAEGVRDTARYVHSVLGMDDAAFRASVFAEQKQLAAFSLRRPEERRALVLQLLGITPVDAARDRARRDARESQASHDKLRSLLPSLGVARAEAGERAAAAASAVERGGAAEQAAGAAGQAARAAAGRFDGLDGVRQEHELVSAEARSIAATVAGAGERVARGEADLADLATAADELARLRPEAEGIGVVEARVKVVEAVASAREAAGAAAGAVPGEPARPDEEGVDAARLAVELAGSSLGEVEGRLAGARAEQERAAQAASRSDRLTAGADCPLCGQALGDAFAQVQAHRQADLAAARDEVARLDAVRKERSVAAEAAASAASRAVVAFKQARLAWASYEKACGHRDEALRRASVAEEALAGCPVAEDELAGLRADLARRRRAAGEVARLAGRLERRPRLEADLAGERLAVADGRGLLEALEEKLAGFGFRPEELALARAERDRLAAESSSAARMAEAARLAATQASAAAEAATSRLAEAEAQHERLAEQADEARHLGRLADLLGAFRNQLVASIGPRLAAQAADLFAELTDREYDELRVDADTYEIQIRDGGQVYGMDRFSGSETDLANLALRVAISEQVRFQSGGSVGLLVLDEVFGPLDDDRKERMLLALENLKSRFRQILVVTHDAAIKEQLPNALEVVKLAGRRAEVRVLV